MKKKKFNWKAIIISVVVLGLVGFGVVFALTRPLPALLGQQAYDISTVTRGDIKVSIHGTGSMEAMDTQNVYSATSGKVDKVAVEEGAVVAKGQVLAVLNGDALNDKIDSLKEQIITQDAAISSMVRGNTGVKTLVAPVESRVKAIYAMEGQDTNVSMSAHNALMLLSTDGKLKVEFTPVEGVKLSAGQAVNLIIGGKAVKGFVTLVPDGTTATAEAQIADDSYAIGKEVMIQNTDGKEIGKGTLEVNRPLLLTAYSGTVDQIYPDLNDVVKANRRLVKLDGAVLSANFEAQIVKRQQLNDDLDQAYADQAKLAITAPADGIVTGLTLKEGAMAQDGMQVCTIQSQSSFKLVVAVDELDVPKISIGQKADVKIDALPDAKATAEVIKIAQVGNKVNDVTTYDVTLKVTAPAGALAGMSSSADIEVAFKSGTLLVPVEAIQTIGGKTYVFATLEGDGQSVTPGQGSGNNSPFVFSMNRNGRKAGAQQVQRQQIDVKVGLISDTQAEILEGLNEGDKVAVPVASSSANSMFNMGGVRTGGGNQQAPAGGSGK